MSATITTHVLDTARGLPGVGVPVTAFYRTGNAWVEKGSAMTDADGRVRDLIAPGAFDSGEWRLVFDTGLWFAGHGEETFYPQVTIHFEVKDAGQHYHVPLLLNPFGYTTYRGT